MGNNERSGGSSSSSSVSSAKNKSKNKSSISSVNGGGNSGGGDKPRQPQRGLGVAQLEKIRLHTQMASCGFLPHHIPLHPPFPNHPFQEEMRFQAGFHGGMHPSSVAPFVYTSPPPMGSSPSSSFGYHPNFMMGMGNHIERSSNIRYSESQPCITATARWNPNINNNVIPVPEGQRFTQPPTMVTRHLLSHVEQNNGSMDLFSLNSSKQESKSSENDEELDLELKL